MMLIDGDRVTPGSEDCQCQPSPCSGCGCLDAQADLLRQDHLRGLSVGPGLPWGHLSASEQGMWRQRVEERSA